MNLPSLNRFGDLARVQASEPDDSEKCGLPSCLPSLQKSLTSPVLNRKLALGASKKTKWQKEKEAADLKAKQAELDAAAAYDEFVKSFEGPSTDEQRFVKAGQPQGLSLSLSLSLLEYLL